jgi:hypothetical protein
MKEKQEKLEEKLANLKINSTLTGDIKDFTVPDLIEWDVEKLTNVTKVCLKFAKIISPVKLYPYQIEPISRIFDTVLTNDGDEITLLMARQMGKGQVMATAIATLLLVAPVLYEKFPDKFPYFKRGILIGVFAPTAEQCSTLHARVQSLLTTDKTLAVLEEQALRKRGDSGVIEIQGGLRKINGKDEPTWVSQAKFMSAAKQAKIESKSFNILFVDECQEVDDMKLMKSIVPMGAAYNASVVLAGTPTTYTCEFYNATSRNRINDATKSKGGFKRCHFEYDYTVGQKYNERYKAHINKVIERYGASSDYFQMSYALRWLVDQGMAVTPSDFNEYIACNGADCEDNPQSGYTYVAGLDLGKDTDPSVLTIMKLTQTVKGGPILKTAVKWFEFSDKLWEEQFAKIVSWIKHFGCISLAVDSTGKGDPISEILMRMLHQTHCTVIRVTFSLKTKHVLATEFYEDLYKGQARCVASGTARKSKEFRKFFTEMTSAVKTYKQGFLQIEHPKDLTTAHDDYVDSFLLALHAARKMDTFIARQENVSLFRKVGNSYDERFKETYQSTRVKLDSLFKKSYY